MSKEVNTSLQKDLQKAEKLIKSVLSGKTEITLEKLTKLQEALHFAETSVRTEIKYFDK